MERAYGLFDAFNDFPSSLPPVPLLASRVVQRPLGVTGGRAG